MGIKSIALGASALVLSTSVNAALIAEYNFDNAAGTTQVATTVNAGYTASSLNLVNASAS